AVKQAHTFLSSLRRPSSYTWLQKRDLPKRDTVTTLSPQHMNDADSGVAVLASWKAETRRGFTDSASCAGFVAFPIGYAEKRLRIQLPTPLMRAGGGHDDDDEVAAVSMEVEDFKIMRKTKTKEKLVMVMCLMDVGGILREKTKFISLGLASNPGKRKVKKRYKKAKKTENTDRSPTHKNNCVAYLWGQMCRGPMAEPCCRWKQSAAPCHRARGDGDGRWFTCAPRRRCPADSGNSLPQRRHVLGLRLTC
ncbi:hypothetical protein MUK42_33092, partial [Musa troglodytarum]